MTNLRNVNPVKLPHWKYLGGQRIALNGASLPATIPSDCTVISIRAMGGDVYYVLNQPGLASTSSPGCVPENSAEIIGHLSNLDSFDVYGAASTYAHIQYFTEVIR